MIISEQEIRALPIRAALAFVAFVARLSIERRAEGRRSGSQRKTRLKTLLIAGICDRFLDVAVDGTTDGDELIRHGQALQHMPPGVDYDLVHCLSHATIAAGYFRNGLLDQAYGELFKALQPVSRIPLSRVVRAQFDQLKELAQRDGWDDTTPIVFDRKSNQFALATEVPTDEWMPPLD